MPVTVKEVRVCRNCGCTEQDGAPLSGCSENRAKGPGQLHDYVNPSDRPFADMDTEALRSRAIYYALKATGSVATFQAFARHMDDATIYTVRLYREKAVKRTRMLSLYLEELEARFDEADDLLWQEEQALIDRALADLEAGGLVERDPLYPTIWRLKPKEAPDAQQTV